jgi:molybdopterin adenylyltransferase
MQLPDTFKTLVVTLSDRASRGEYEDASGPLVRDRIAAAMKEAGWNTKEDLVLIPDDQIKLTELLDRELNNYNLIITTGGTGIGPRDITVDTIKPKLRAEIPGIMELIRVKYGSLSPNALLSRAVAGVIGNTLIFTLPGSVRAVNEYLDVIIPLLHHTIYMQYGIDAHGKR